MRKKTGKIIKYVLICLLLALFMVPFYLMVLNSFKTTQQFVGSPFAWPDSFDFKNYANALENMNFFSAFGNSLLISVISVAFILLSSSMAAYFLVRHKWRISKVVFAVYVASMIVPFQAVMIPLVVIYGRLGLMNSNWILMFMYGGFGQGLAIFIFHGFIKNIPLEMEEAALIDGCNKMQSFFRIVFPLLKPVVMTVLILDVLWIWNDYLLPSLVLLSPESRTLPLSTYNFFQTFSIDFAPLMAGIVLTILPVLIIYIFCQKHIVRGVVQGAIK